MPSADLRQWFGHDPTRFEEFRKRYTQELGGKRLQRCGAEGATATLTLVYAAGDTENNDAVVLAEVLRRRLRKATKERR